MDTLINLLGGVLSSESDSRVIVITLIVLLILAAIAIGIITVVYKMYKSIKSESKEEHQREMNDEKYRQKVDETRSDIDSIAKLINRLSETIQTSNESTHADIVAIQKLINDQSIEGCQYGRKNTENMDNFIHELKDDVLLDLKSNVEILLESDREGIKTFITEQYHYWMNKGYIDIYTRKGIDERFIRYRKENGNSFVTSMVEELHRLPTKVMVDNVTNPRLVEESRQEKILPSEFFEDANEDGIPDFIFDDSLLTPKMTPDGNQNQ